MANETLCAPPLPAYTLQPVPPLLSWISDFHLSLLLPVAAYWLMSLLFWCISVYDLFSQYRLHTPTELKQRNRVSATEVLRTILAQQAIQTALGLLIGYLTSPGDFHGREQYDIAVWAGRLHQARQAVPWILTVIGIDTEALGEKVQAGVSAKSGTVNVLAVVPRLVKLSAELDAVSGYANWEMWAAKAMYWVGEPAARFGFAIFFSDSWQYFWHRAMHSNQWMYRESPLDTIPQPSTRPETLRACMAASGHP